MGNSEITSDKVLSLISQQWLTNVDIANGLGLKSPLDRRYLNLKLNELLKKEEVVYELYNERIYWSRNNAVMIEELLIGFYMALLDEDPFDAELWHKLGIQYLEWNWDLGGIEEADLYITEIFTQGKEYFKNALRFVEPEINFQLYCEILLDLGMTHIMLEEPDKAFSQLKKLIEIQEQLEKKIMGRMYLELAQVSLIKNEYNKALDYAIKSNEKIPNEYDVKEVLRQIKDSITERKELLETDQGFRLISSDNKEQESKIPQSMLWEMLQEVRKLAKFSDKSLESSDKRNLILIRSFVSQSLDSVLEKPGKKTLNKLKTYVTNSKENWPDDLWELYVQEFHQRLELFKNLQPSKWKKWGNALLKIIPLIH